MNKNTKDWIYIILAYLCGILAIAGAIYVGLYIMFIHGIVMTVHGICSHPVNASKIAWGIVRVFFAAPAAGLILLSAYLGKIFIKLAD